MYRMKLIIYVLYFFSLEHALAQEGGYSAGARLKDIEVYPHANNGLPVEVLTNHYQQEEFSELNLDLMKELSIKNNLILTQNGAFSGIQNIYLRGANSDQVNVIFDGIVLNDPSHPARGVNLSEVTNFALESADIYYGTSGSFESIDTSPGTIDFKGMNVDRGQVALKIGSYESLGSRILLPLFNNESNHHQVELYTFETRGMSSYNEGTEHDGKNENKLKLKGKVKPSSSINMEYIFLGHWTKESLDFAGGANGADDPNYFTRKKLIVPYIKFDSKSACFEYGSSYQKSLRKNKTDNYIDELNATESYYTSHGTMEISKAFLSSNCIKNMYFGFLFQRDFETMNLYQIGSNPTVIDTVRNEIHSMGLNSLITINDKQKMELTFKMQDWKNQFDISGLKVGMTKTVNAEISLTPVLSYSRKNPSLYQLYSEYGKESLIPEKYFLGEIYFKFEPYEIWSISLSPFYGRFKDMIDFVTVGSNSEYENIGEVVNYGAELRQLLKLNEEAGFRLNVNYLKSYNKLNSQQLLLRPRWQISQISYYNFNKFQFELQLQYLDKRFGTDALTFSRVVVPSHLLVHSGISYELSDNFSAKLSLQNLLNKQYMLVPGYSSLGLSAFSEMIYTF